MKGPVEREFHPVVNIQKGYDNVDLYILYCLQLQPLRLSPTFV